MNQPQELPAVLWFRSLPKWKQWTIGLPFIVWALLEHVRKETTKQPEQLAFIQTLILFVVVLVASELLRPKPKFEDARPAGLGDFKFPTATEGRVIPIIWGTVLVESMNVVWYGALEQEAIRETVKTGLWDKATFTKGFRYYIGVQAGICRGGAGLEFTKVLIGDTEVWSGVASSTIDIDKPDLFGGDDLGLGGIKMTLEVYPGTTTQSPSTYLSRYQDSGAGTTRTPRYTGLCYVVARELNGDPATCRGAYVGNSTTIKPWKFEVRRFAAAFPGQLAGQHIINTHDCNPINVLYEILTNTEWGFGFPSADIDIGSGPTSSFWSASDTCYDEGLGFSMSLDKAIEAADLIKEVERHIDGILYLDQASGKWKIKLARADYSIGSVPQFTVDNIKEVRDFTRGTWEETINQITVKFNLRQDNYKESYALAQDSANFVTQGGGTISTGQSVVGQVSFPGVKNKDTANLIAWRELRLRSYPLARATFVTNRVNWNLTVGGVIAWTDPKYGFSQLAMRVIKLDFGRLQANEMTVTCVQDIFQYIAPSGGAPPETNWTAPEASLVAYPSTQQLVYEAPRAIVVRDPFYDGSTVGSRVHVAARKQGLESSYTINQRNAAGATSGSYAECGEVASFMKIGQLQASMSNAQANPLSTLTVSPSPDIQTQLEAAFNDAASLVDIGTNLLHLILIDDEFMLVDSASISGSDVLLSGVYRGVLDTAQRAHSAGANVYLVFVGSGLADYVFPNTNNVDIQLRAKYLTGNIYAGSVTTVSLAMAKRSLRPYPPSAIRFNSSSTPFTTPSMEGAGSGLNGFRIDVDWWRRDYTATDEIAAVLADMASTDASTEYQLEVRADPAGTNTLVGSVSAWTTGTGTLQVLRTDIVTAAAAGTQLRFIIRTRHDVGSEVDLTSRSDFRFDVTPSSSLTGQFYLGGGLAALVASASYTAAATGTFTLNIGAVQATANIQVSINGGGWSTVIAAGVTTGTFSANSGDTIRVRRSVNESPNPQFVELRNPSSTAVAYGTFRN